MAGSRGANAARETATPQDVRDGVEDYAAAVDSRSSSLVGSWKMGLDALPFSVGEMCRVAPFHAQERTSSTCPTRFFKQSLVLQRHFALPGSAASVLGTLQRSLIIFATY